MRKQLRETIVGLFVIFGVVVFVILYIWLSGRISLRNTYDITVLFNDVIGLRTGDPVMVYGIEKGQVKSISIAENQVKTVIALDRSIRLPEDSKIAIRSISYLGADRYIKITPGVSQKTAVVFQGASETLDLESMVTKFDSLLNDVKKTVDGLRPEALTDVAKQLSEDINKNVSRLVDMIEDPTQKVETVVEKTEVVVEQLDSLSRMLQRGDGTLGKLARSDELYQELRQTNLSLKELFEDIKDNPKKYLQHIKVF
jgi:phospholipid/cholesterol/gamma-HCH transport system substrate-binding protein